MTFFAGAVVAGGTMTFYTMVLWKKAEAAMTTSYLPGKTLCQTCDLTSQENLCPVTIR